MKYIITENKMESLIKEYILKSYDVMDVEITTKKIYLGSGPNKKGETSLTQKVINVYIENIRGKKGFMELSEISSSLWEVLDSLFSLDLGEYGSEWSLKVYQVIRKEI